MGGDGVELLWPGKYGAAGERAPLPSTGEVIAVDLRLGGPPAVGADRLILADNLAASDALLAAWRGSVDLIYIDPPFGTGQKFSRTIALAGGEELRAPAFEDRWAGGLGGYLAMLDPRLRLCHALLAARGSLYVHVDPIVAHPVKLLLDEIFGAGCFQREIVWRIGWLSGFKTRARNWIRNHDTIFFYTRDPGRFTFNKQLLPYPLGYVRRDGSPPKGLGAPIDDVWNAGPGDLALRGRESLDSIQIKSFSREKTGWATQKNESLLRRIIGASSNPGDLVADLFCGSGTTLAVAAAMGRRFVGCDRSAAAIHVARGRLRGLGAAFELCSLRPGGEAAAHAGARATVEAAGDGARPSLVVQWRGDEPWAAAVELVRYAPKAGAEAAAALALEWVDTWALCPDAQPLTPALEVSRRAGAVLARVGSVKVAATGATEVAWVLWVVDVLGGESRWRYRLRFSSEGALVGVQAGDEDGPEDRSMASAEGRGAVDEDGLKDRSVERA